MRKLRNPSCRLHPFYRGRDASQHLPGLRDVLRCYCLFNWDLGYCQGMSDLASPLLVVMEGDEVGGKILAAAAAAATSTVFGGLFCMLCANCVRNCNKSSIGCCQHCWQLQSCCHCVSCVARKPGMQRWL
jgi:hypothetical protein